MGEVFRVVNNDPPNQTDFVTQRERFPKKELDDECIARGLSIYTDKSDVHRMIRRIPSRRKRLQLIASGELNQDMGVMSPSPHGGDSHHTWWMTFGCAAWEVFAVVEVIQPQQFKQ